MGDRTFYWDQYHCGTPTLATVNFVVKLTLSRAKPIITVHMLCCALQENVVSKQQFTQYDQETTDQYIFDCKVLNV